MENNFGSNNSENTGNPKNVSTHICHLPVSERKRKVSEKELRLAERFKEDGYVSGFIVAKKSNFGAYDVVYNFSILRAAMAANMDTVPAFVGSFDKLFEEEVQTADEILKGKMSPITEAKFYKSLIRKESHRSFALKNNLRPTTLRNKLKLLELAGKVQEMVERGDLGVGQARTIAYIKDAASQLKLAEYVVAQRLSVRQVEEFVHGKKKIADIVRSKDPDVLELEKRIGLKLQAKAEFSSSGESGELCVTAAPGNAAEWLSRIEGEVSERAAVSICFKLRGKSRAELLVDNPASVGDGVALLLALSNQEALGKFTVQYSDLDSLDAVLKSLIGDD